MARPYYAYPSNQQKKIRVIRGVLILERPRQMGR